MPIRPESERKLNARFQRRVDEQAERHAAELAHAEQLAARLECGQVVGVFSTRTGGGVRASGYVAGFLPLAAIPLLIVGTRIPGVAGALLIFPFAWGAWFALSMWLGWKPSRWVWFLAFDEGFMLLNDPQATAVPVRWSQITEVAPVWTQVYEVGSDGEYTTPKLTAYGLRLMDGQSCEISRSFKNVRDPYGDVGQMLRTVMPVAAGKVLPTFPTIDDVMAAYAVNRGPRP